MAAGLVERALRVIEILAAHAGGLPLHNVAEGLDIPKSATHRLLAELMRLGYVRQSAGDGSYALTPKIVSLGFRYLADSGVVDLAQPILDGLAAEVGELVGLAVTDGGRLAWVAKSQGAKSGLRFDLDMGEEAPLSCSASGLSWLACLDDEQAFELVARQGISRPANAGANAPRTIAELLVCLDRTRERGYAVAVDSYAAGVASMAAAIRHPDGQSVAGVVCISGPSARLDENRLAAMAPALLKVAGELSAVVPRPAMNRPGK